jgi:hypothetical protein
MSLPESWIDRIFGRLMLTYGAAFSRMWEGLDMAAVRETWAQELAGFAHHPEAIGYALENLPAEKPPTALVFRQICRLAPEPKRKPDPEQLKLPPPKRDPERMRALLGRLQSLERSTNPLAWAYALQERERRGENLTEAQRLAWREAMCEVPPDGLMDYQPVPVESLPPAMRAELEDRRP